MQKVLGKALAAVLLVTFALSGCTGDNKYVATIGGEKVTPDEYKFFNSITKKEIEQKYGVSDEAAIKKFWTDKVEGEDPVVRFKVKDTTLEKIQEYKMLLVKAKENKIEITKEEQKDIEEKLKQNIEKSGGQQKAEEEIKKDFGITLDTYKEIANNYTLVSKYIEAEKKTLEVKDEDIKKYYDDDKGGTRLEFYKADVRHILFLTQDEATKQPLPKEKADEKKKKADEIMAKAKAGENFADLAKKYSEDPGSKDKGGLYENVRKIGQYVPEFEDWSLNSKVGDIGIVQTSYGYHVMKLEKKEKIPYDELKETIKGVLLSEKMNEKIKEWKKDKKYEVIKNNDVLNTMG
ncbi:MAG: peptidylprolyl isomerase [Clostridia bacterium]|nr:peptidylprolyl isomerase [Clostridia bacterium]